MTPIVPPGPIDHMLEALVSLGRIKQQHESTFNTLSQREIEVLALVAEGLPNPEIACQLNISRATVQNHRASIRQKLDIVSEADYVKFALAYSLIKL